VPREWMDVSKLSFNTLLLLEPVQLSALPGRLSVQSMRVALRANPAVEWYLRRKCPQINGWLNLVMTEGDSDSPAEPEAIREAEAEVLTSITDLIVYAVDPAVYDRQPFLNWDNRELTGLIDFTGTTVIDVGAGTGRLALAVADKARVVFAVEPVRTLRLFEGPRAREAARERLPGRRADHRHPLPQRFRGRVPGRERVRRGPHRGIPRDDARHPPRGRRHPVPGQPRRGQRAPQVPGGPSLPVGAPGGAARRHEAQILAQRLNGPPRLA
jgi:hypothetical protein